MAVVYNIKGTSQTEFQIGKSGPKLVKNGNDLELQTPSGSVVTTALSSTTLDINGISFPDPTTATTGQYLKYNSGSLEWAVVPTPTTFTPITAYGTGSSQNVTLPYSGLTVNDVNVFVNGLKYPTSDYSISDTTLTLTTNASGDAIEITCPVVITTPTGGGNDLSVTSTMVVPSASDFTVTKPSGATATLTDLAGGRGLHVESHGSIDNWQGTMLTYNGWTPPSSGSWYFRTLLTVRWISNGYGAGPAVTDSTGKTLVEAQNSGTNTRWIFDSVNFDNNTNRDATNSEDVTVKSREWWGIRCDGTNIYGQRSLDGEIWWDTDTVSVSSFTSGTLDHIGIGIMAYHASNRQHTTIWGIQHS